MRSGRMSGTGEAAYPGVWRRLRLALAAVSGGLAAACTPLAAFNALVPKDRGVVRIVSAAPFGSDPRQRLDLYAPRRTPPGARLPVIVWIYGGSWSSGERRGYGFVARAFAALGFIVAVPDYRLVPQVRFPAFLEDNAAAVRWVRANVAANGGDPDRLVLAGHSAGAYDVAMLAMDPRWLGPDRAAVRGWIGLAGPYDFLPLSGPVAEAAFGAWPRPEETQPIRYASAGGPPAFLAAGARDGVVKPRNTTRLASKLTKRGVPVETHIYPDIAHVGIVTALARPLRGKAPVLTDAVAFAKRVTG